MWKRTFRSNQVFFMTHNALFPKGSLFLGHGPYFKCFGYIHAKNVNSACREREGCAGTQQWDNLICAVLDHHLPLEMISIVVGTCSVLHCWQILILSFVYALDISEIDVSSPNFSCQGWIIFTEYWSLFQNKFGPYCVPTLNLEVPRFWEQWLLCLLGLIVVHPIYPLPSPDFQHPCQQIWHTHTP